MEKSEMIWKEVPDFPGYEVSEYGDLRRDGKELKPERIRGSGRKRFKLSKNGCQYTRHAAYLVALTFIGPRPRGQELRHKDGFEHNNHFSNLIWGSHQANMGDKVRHALNRDEQSNFPAHRTRQLSVDASEFLGRHLS